MGKYENMMKCAQIRSLANEKQYKNAYDVLQTLDLDKITAIADLNAIADVYTKLQKFQEARNVYLRLYDKIHTRRVLYQLVYLSAKCGESEEAEKFYSEYEDKDKTSDKIILRYYMARAKDTDRKALIPILVELKKEEYMEEWAYELAKLYHKEGMKEECVQECSDIALWFGEGLIVEKALLLKHHYLEGADISSEKAILAETKNLAAELKIAVAIAERNEREKARRESAASAMAMAKASMSKASMSKANVSMANVSMADMPKANMPKADIPKAGMANWSIPKEDIPQENNPWEEIIKEETPREEIGQESISENIISQESVLLEINPEEDAPKANIPKESVSRGHKLKSYFSWAKEHSLAVSLESPYVEGCLESEDMEAEREEMQGQCQEEPKEFGELELEQKFGAAVTGKFQEMEDWQLQEPLEDPEAAPEIPEELQFQEPEHGEANGLGQSGWQESEWEHEEPEYGMLPEAEEDEEELEYVEMEIEDLLPEEDDSASEMEREIKKIVREMKKEKDPGHIAIAGDAPDKNMELARYISEELYQQQVLSASKIESIHAEKVADANLMENRNKFSGGCLFIEEANSLSIDAMQELFQFLNKARERVTVIFSDTEDEINKLIKKNRKLRNMIEYHIQI